MSNQKNNMHKQDSKAQKYSQMERNRQSQTLQNTNSYSSSQNNEEVPKSVQKQRYGRYNQEVLFEEMNHINVFGTFKKSGDVENRDEFENIHSIKYPDSAQNNIKNLQVSEQVQYTYDLSKFNKNSNDQSLGLNISGDFSYKTADSKQNSSQEEDVFNFQGEDQTKNRYKSHKDKTQGYSCQILEGDQYEEVEQIQIDKPPQYHDRQRLNKMFEINQKIQLQTPGNIYGNQNSRNDYHARNAKKYFQERSQTDYQPQQRNIQRQKQIEEQMKNQIRIKQKQVQELKVGCQEARIENKLMKKRVNQLEEVLKDVLENIKIKHAQNTYIWRKYSL